MVGLLGLTVFVLADEIHVLVLLEGLCLQMTLSFQNAVFGPHFQKHIRCYLIFHDVHWENSLLHGKLLRSCTTSKKKGVASSVSRATLSSLVGDLI